MSVPEASSPPTLLTKELPESAPEEVRAAAREAVESWGGEWTEQGASDRIRLPIQAGLRHGLASGELRVAGSGRSSRLELELAPVAWRLHGPAVAVLAPAALAAVAVVLWPFFPALGPLVPLGLLAGLGAWFLVVARLQNRGPEELVEQIAASLQLPAASVQPEADSR